MRTFGIERSQGPPGDAAGSHGSPSRDIFFSFPKDFGKAARIPPLRYPEYLPISICHVIFEDICRLLLSHLQILLLDRESLHDNK